MPISHDALDDIYRSAQQIQSGIAQIGHAKQDIVSRYGLNPNTTSALINNVRHLFEGTPYKRATAVDDMDYLLGLLGADVSAAQFEKALCSVEGHIAYYEGYSGATQWSLRDCVVRHGGPLRPSPLVTPEAARPIAAIADELNARAKDYEIGGLQNLRVRLRNLRRRPGAAIFGQTTTTDKWAFHHGGRHELQFNIGLEDPDFFRFGVAFSFTTSQTMPSLEGLFPSIQRFNDFFRESPGAYSDLSMWHYQGGERSILRSPGPIAGELVAKDVFVFLGLRVPRSQIDFDQVLELFDRLLPLYIAVESREVVPLAAIADFQLRPGCPPRPTRTSFTPAQRAIDVSLKHNALQRALYAELELEHGKGNVGIEQSPGGLRVDVVAKIQGEWWYFEIKTSVTARGCIREALGQLLEYAYWPAGTAPSHLVVVGDPPEADATSYLKLLRTNFNIPLTYRQVKLVSHEDE